MVMFLKVICGKVQPEYGWNHPIGCIHRMNKRGEREGGEEGGERRKGRGRDKKEREEKRGEGRGRGLKR